MEPAIREALERLPAEERVTPEAVVGSYWTRTNDPELDLVFADRAPAASRILGVGSIKWLEKAPFDGRDLARLVQHRAQLPGASEDTPIIAVARSGCIVEGVRLYGPEDLLAAW